MLKRVEVKEAVCGIIGNAVKESTCKVDVLADESISAFFVTATVQRPLNHKAEAEVVKEDVHKGIIDYFSKENVAEESMRNLVVIVN